MNVIRTMLTALAVMAVLARFHVIITLAGTPLAVPVLVAVLGVELAAIALVCWLIARACRTVPWRAE